MIRNDCAQHFMEKIPPPEDFQRKNYYFFVAGNVQPTKLESKHHIDVGINHHCAQNAVNQICDESRTFYLYFLKSIQMLF